MLPSAEGKAEPASAGRVCARRWRRSRPSAGRRADERQEVRVRRGDDGQRPSALRHADFNALGAAEYRLVERLARDVALPVPRCRRGACARPRAGDGARMHWPGVLREAARTGGELMQLPRLQRREEPLPLLVLVDVSGSMERYARLLLAFLHAATRGARPHGPARRVRLRHPPHRPDARVPPGRHRRMLAAASAAIDDFAGGTRLGESLASLRKHHARRLVGGRTLVLLITDGLDTGEPDDAGARAGLASACRRAAVAQSAAALQRLRAGGARRGRAAPAWPHAHAGGAQPQRAGRSWRPAWPP